MRLVAKHAQVGYLTPGQRPGCRNCRFVETYRPESGVCYSSPRLTCTKHDIEVTSGGICNSHASPTQGVNYRSLLNARDMLERQLAEKQLTVVHQVELPKAGKSYQVATGFGERLFRERTAEEQLAARGGLTPAEHSAELVRQMKAPQARERRA
ncbi:hypothetical protein [Ramlibacter sp. 2FC]|uniref:hypothetical protein n=1 Tax=Ramlibacter sp. 2FC TaxID=2502188 RepID=UPI0010FA42AE|nr:hypothetical protein [Ramlibacter sp. 2FC]